MPYTVPDLLLDAARTTPDHPAVIDGDTVLSYARLADRAHRHAGALARLHAPGARIALLLPRGAPALAVYFATHLARLVPVFVHEQLRPRQVAAIVEHAQASLVVTTDRLRPLLRDCPTTNAACPGDLVGAPLDTTPTPAIDRDLAALAYTSGSTGAAKGVMLSHANLLAGAAIVADYLRLTPRDRTLALLPWSFDYGLNQVLATFAARGTVVVQRSAFPPDICRALTASAVTGLAGVPTLWASLVGPRSPFTTTEYPALRYLTNSGGALPPAVTRAIRDAHPDVRLYSMYGLTEAFRSTTLDPDLIDTKPGSVGRAIPNTQVLVLDEHDRPCAPHTRGEIVHRGATVALGYWRDPHGTTAVFRPHPHLPEPHHERVVRSGDLGHTDSDGDLYITGRRDELVKIRGIRVTPTEIETEIMASGLTTTVVAIIAPDAGDPRVLVAVHPHDPALTAHDIDAYCRAELPPHMRPHHIAITEHIPRTPHGKVDRDLVRDLLDNSGARP